MVLILLLLLTAFHTLVELYERRQSSPPPSNEQPQNENNLPDELSEEVPPEIEPEEQQIPPVQVERDPEADGVRFIVRHADSIKAEMSFTGSCWIRVLADGDNVFEGTLQAGQTNMATATEQLSIRIGNPPVMQLVINEQSYSAGNDRLILYLLSVQSSSPDVKTTFYLKVVFLLKLNYFDKPSLLLYTE